MSDNPFAPPQWNNDALTDISNQPRKRNTFFEILVVFGIIVVMIGLLLPGVRMGGRPAARRMQCMNHLKQIGLALMNYESRYNSLPPAYTTDAKDRPLHSWRTLLLPYLEEQALYDLIDLSKPWDAPENEAARTAAVHVTVFSCPSASFSDEPCRTTYLAVIDEHQGLHPTKLRKLNDRDNNSEDGLIVVDAPASMEVHWMSPQDLAAAELLNFDPQTDGPHHGVYLGLFADGSVRTSKDDWD
jgi:type II secretory pathway pseudopilin PulG